MRVKWKWLSGSGLKILAVVSMLVDHLAVFVLVQVVEGKEISVYDKHCLSLSKEEVEKNLAEGKPFVIRQNNPTEGTTTFHDELYGDVTVDNKELDDMILIKSDGYPTYNFANVVDDHLMGITHVVRGNEYISSSPKYNRLYDAFGWEVPKYIHCPLITDEEHKKLSKRSGHSSFEDLIEQGFLPEAVVNFVALLGWSPDDNNEIMSLQELIEKFDYKRINKSPAVFDYTKLKWMNGEYLKAMDEDKFFEMAKPYLEEAITNPSLKSDDKLKKIANMVKTRIEIFPDIKDMVDFFNSLNKRGGGLTPWGKEGREERFMPSNASRSKGTIPTKDFKIHTYQDWVGNHKPNGVSYAEYMKMEL